MGALPSKEKVPRLLIVDGQQRLTSLYAVDRLHDLRDYPFKAVELSSSVEEEQVAEVFVRIRREADSWRTSHAAARSRRCRRLPEAPHVDELAF